MWDWCCFSHRYCQLLPSQWSFAMEKNSKLSCDGKKFRIQNFRVHLRWKRIRVQNSFAMEKSLKFRLQSLLFSLLVPCFAITLITCDGKEFRACLRWKRFQSSEFTCDGKGLRVQSFLSLQRNSQQSDSQFFCLQIFITLSTKWNSFHRMIFSIARWSMTLHVLPLFFYSSSGVLLMMIDSPCSFMVLLLFFWCSSDDQWLLMFFKSPSQSHCKLQTYSFMLAFQILIFFCVYCYAGSQPGQESDQSDHTDWSNWRRHYLIEKTHENSSITAKCKHCGTHFHSMSASRGKAHVYKVPDMAVRLCTSIPDKLRAKLKPWKLAEEEHQPMTSQASFATGKCLCDKLWWWLNDCNQEL